MPPIIAHCNNITQGALRQEIFYSSKYHNVRQVSMAEFKRQNLENFLSVVKKYMQLRGNLSQKDLADKTEIGVSTMSRFFSQKNVELNHQLIAKLVAILNIPSHEIIDFVEEDFSERFIRLVQFYKDNQIEIVPNNQNEPTPAKNKLDNLTPRQKTFITEFLNLKMEERDLVVDLGNNLLQYFKMKDMQDK